MALRKFLRSQALPSRPRAPQRPGGGQRADQLWQTCRATEGLPDDEWHQSAGAQRDGAVDHARQEAEQPAAARLLATGLELPASQLIPSGRVSIWVGGVGSYEAICHRVSRPSRKGR